MAVSMNLEVLLVGVLMIGALRFGAANLLCRIVLMLGMLPSCNQPALCKPMHIGNPALNCSTPCIGPRFATGIGAWRDVDTTNFRSLQDTRAHLTC